MPWRGCDLRSHAVREATYICDAFHKLWVRRLRYVRAEKEGDERVKEDGRGRRVRVRWYQVQAWSEMSAAALACSWLMTTSLRTMGVAPPATLVNCSDM